MQPWHCDGWSSLLSDLLHPLALVPAIVNGHPWHFVVTIGLKCIATKEQGIVSAVRKQVLAGTYYETCHVTPIDGDAHQLTVLLYLLIQHLVHLCSDVLVSGLTGTFDLALLESTSF